MCSTVVKIQMALLSYVYHGLQHSSVKIQMAVLMSKIETATGTVRVTRMRHGEYAATCSTVRCKRFLGARKQQSAPLCGFKAYQQHRPGTATVKRFHSFLHI